MVDGCQQRVRSTVVVFKRIERDKYFNQPAMIKERLKHVETQLTNIYQWLERTTS